MKSQGNYLGLASRYFRGKYWEVNNRVEDTTNTGSYHTLTESVKEVAQTSLSSCSNILQLPDDVLLEIFSYLQILDIVR